MKTGLLCSVYRPADLGDATNGGVTSRAQTVVLIDEGAPEPLGPFRGAADLPVLRIVRRVIAGQPYVHAEPVEGPGEGTIGRWMAGGHFIYTSDSRFRRQVSDYPIPVHDRTETPELYDILSR